MAYPAQPEIVRLAVPATKESGCPAVSGVASVFPVNKVPFIVIEMGVE